MEDEFWKSTKLYKRNPKLNRNNKQPGRQWHIRNQFGRIKWHYAPKFLIPKTETVKYVRDKIILVSSTSDQFVMVPNISGDTKETGREVRGRIKDTHKKFPGFVSKKPEHFFNKNDEYVTRFWGCANNSGKIKGSQQKNSSRDPKLNVTKEILPVKTNLQVKSKVVPQTGKVNNLKYKNYEWAIDKKDEEVRSNDSKINTNNKKGPKHSGGQQGQASQRSSKKNTFKNKIPLSYEFSDSKIKNFDLPSHNIVDEYPDPARFWNKINVIQDIESVKNSINATTSPKFPFELSMRWITTRYSQEVITQINRNYANYDHRHTYGRRQNTRFQNNTRFESTMMREYNADRRFYENEAYEWRRREQTKLERKDAARRKRENDFWWNED